MKLTSKPDPNKYLIVEVEGHTYRLTGERIKDEFHIDPLYPSVYIWEPPHEYGPIIDVDMHSELIEKMIEQTKDTSEKIILK